MAQTPTELARTVEIAGTKSGYDAACRLVLSQRIVLAHILKRCVEEYRDCSPEEICGFIDRDPSVGETEVGRGLSNAFITGNSTDDVSVNEGSVRYDVLFSSAVPGMKEGRLGLIINVEAQKVMNPGYSLHRRAAYYSARLVSSQFGADIRTADYSRLKRVYSIWICYNTPEEHRNSINMYRKREETLEGRGFGDDAGADLSREIVICTGSPDEASGLLRLLSVLFSGKLRSGEKKRILSSEFSMPMTREIDKGVTEMCNLSEGIYEEGRIEGRAEDVRALMENLSCSAEKAMDLLDVPQSERSALINTGLIVPGQQSEPSAAF